MRRPYLAAAAALVLLGSTAAGFNYAGICLTDPTVDDDRRIRRAIEYFVESPQLIPSSTASEEMRGLPFRVVENPVTRYTSAEEFIQANPDCCRVTQRASKSEPPGFLTKVSGRFAGYVQLRFVARVPQPSGEIRLVDEEGYYPVTNCGRVWERPH